MRKLLSKKWVANSLKTLALFAVFQAINVQCAYVFHQPKQPEALKKFRKF